MKKELFDQVSYASSKLVTKKYSTSFSLATRMLSPVIRTAIYNIYGFVRFADEIVDSFHNYNKEELLIRFEKEYYNSKKEGISLNPIINSFIHTVRKYNIPNTMVDAFLKSMKADLYKTVYNTEEEYKEYIYGSADVVGLMCLKVFVNGNEKRYNQLKEAAQRLGSAFQKVNFLRDLKDDFEDLNRSYFPNVDFENFNQNSKKEIIRDIEADFEYAFQYGVLKLPVNAKFGVYVAFCYYKKLLKKLKKTPSSKILLKRVRISNLLKIVLLIRSYIRFKLKLI